MGMIIHEGQHSHNGHFVACWKQNECWLKFDNWTVTVLTQEEALGMVTTNEFCFYLFDSLLDTKMNLIMTIT